jgi:hypothetical protein
MPSAVAVHLSPSMTTEGGSNGNWNAIRPPSRVTGVLLVWESGCRPAPYRSRRKALNRSVSVYSAGDIL